MYSTVTVQYVRRRPKNRKQIVTTKKNGECQLGKGCLVGRYGMVWYVFILYSPTSSYNIKTSDFVAGEGN